jgi:hypothetical protein
MLILVSSFVMLLQLKSWSEGPFPKPEIRLSVPAGEQQQKYKHMHQSAATHLQLPAAGAYSSMISLLWHTLISC